MAMTSTKGKWQRRQPGTHHCCCTTEHYNDDNKDNRQGPPQDDDEGTASTGMGTATQHKLQQVADNKADNKEGTNVEGTGDRDSAIQQGRNTKRAQGTSTMSLGPYISFFFLISFHFLWITKILGLDSDDNNDCPDHKINKKTQQVQQ
jgi:hypothetical protein